MELLIIPIVILILWFFGKLLVFIVQQLGASGVSGEYNEQGNGNSVSDSRLAMMGQRIGTFPTSAEAREICENLNQNGDRMYVNGTDILCDGQIDVGQVREAMGDLHDDYWRSH